MKSRQFEHITFDGALQAECMSSDESDYDGAQSAGEESSSRPPVLLRTRGYAWRSSRLLQFFNALDEEDRMDTSKPKRGMGKKERFNGPLKDGFHLPPSGVASWMLSKRWVKNGHEKFPDFSDTLSRLVQDSPGFDWDHFHVLGEESEDSEDEPQTYHDHEFDHGLMQHNLPLHHISTSSLNFALI